MCCKDWAIGDNGQLCMGRTLCLGHKCHPSRILVATLRYQSLMMRKVRWVLPDATVVIECGRGKFNAESALKNFTDTPVSSGGLAAPLKTLHDFRDIEVNRPVVYILNFTCIIL
jgi:hypothetical protein